MNRYLLLTACVASLAPMAAFGGNFQDLDTYVGGSGVGQLVDSTTPLTGNFNFITGGDPSDTTGNVLGYNPAVETVTGFELAFQVTDGSTLQTVNINLDGVSLSTTFVGSITFGGTLSPADTTAILAAAQDGKLPYTLSAPAGSSYNVNYALMKITTGAKGVPEAGSTLALFAAAVGGMGLVRRKLSR
ncbi:MAG: hypothetical protein U1G07_16400 [Verrucomicrobiota bacterium]